MSSQEVHVDAPGRIHLGLLSFGHDDQPYGGVGLMIRPGLKLEILPAREFAATGPLSERVEQIAWQWARFHGHESLPDCQVTVKQAPDQHVGLGSGTQLGLSVVAGLSRFLGMPDLSIGELAACSGRAARSAIGTHGFVHGGLLVERGRRSSDAVAPLECRLPVPDNWCIVLIRPAGGQGLSGEPEQQTFRDLPPVPERVTEQLIEEVQKQMLPALADGDFSEFAESVYRYGNLAGSCFASVQGGAYNGEALNRRVDWLRSLGHAGVGQSSWGPTLFVLSENQQQAELVSEQLRECPTGETLQVEIARPCNQGATITSSGSA
jgi:beta-ribofuranosylaminobenzene 5'-phosphate synthase